MNPNEILHPDALLRATTLLGQKIGSVKKLAGDASSRQYVRCTASNASLIVQINPTPFDTKQFPFAVIQSFLQQHGLPVPKILDAQPEQGLLFLEDLGDRTLQDEVQSGASIIPLYTQALDILAAFQRTSAATNLPHCHPNFDFEKFHFESEYCHTHLYLGYLARPDLGATFQSLIDPMNKTLGAAARVFTHRDYHSRNLMMFNGQMWAIDFQDARLGPLSYDLVSLAFDPYVALTWDQRIHIKNQFARGLAPDLRQIFETEWPNMAIQRLFKASGSFASFFQLQKRPDYLPWIKPALEFAAQICQNYGGKEHQNISLLIKQTQDQVSVKLGS